MRRVDENNVQRQGGVLHPEGQQFFVGKEEQHAMKLRQLGPVHETELSFFRGVGDFNANADRIALLGMDDDLRRRRGGTSAAEPHSKQGERHRDTETRRRYKSGSPRLRVPASPRPHVLVTVQTTPSSFNPARSAFVSPSSAPRTSALCWLRSGAGRSSTGESDNCTAQPGIVKVPRVG